MTDDQQSALERAYARATRRGIVILARGTRKLDGARIFLTNSGSTRDGTHCVTLTGSRLTCDCAARVICCHRAVVHARLAGERAVAESRAARAVDVATGVSHAMLGPEYAARHATSGHSASGSERRSTMRDLEPNPAVAVHDTGPQPHGQPQARRMPYPPRPPRRAMTYHAVPGLRAARLARGHSQFTLQLATEWLQWKTESQNLYVSSGYISQLERGARASSAVVYALARALKVDMRTLLNEPGEPKTVKGNV
jgi:hypothetical protein